MNKIKLRILTLILAAMASISLAAQDNSTNNPIETGVVFLNIAPESRGSALGDAGVATSPDVYSQYWNPAKYAFMKDEFGFGLSYTPWLRSLVDDIGLVDVTGFFRFDASQTVSGSLRYFSMGDIQWTDDDATVQGNIHPHEMAIDLGYSRKFSDNWSGAVSFKYILSDIYSGYGAREAYAAHSFAVDMSAYYHKDDVYTGDYKSNYSFGVNVQNIGRKISYNKGDDRMFLPANLKLGGAYGIDIDNYNTIMATLDINKLLVPTPDPDLEEENENYYNDMGALEGVFSSFGDAPGGFSEEIQEVMLSLGVEYIYDKTFTLRGGYFHENQFKGNRTYFSFGAGFKMNVFALDVSYLVPTDATSPLANTLRFSFSFGVDGIKSILE